MGCHHLQLPDGTHAMVCGVRNQPPKRCAHVDPATGECCRADGAYLCDHPTGLRRDGTERTCSRPCCADHRHSMGPDRDLCLAHALDRLTTFAEVDERAAELMRELVLANEARDLPRFLRADQELAGVYARRAQLIAQADAEARRARAASNKFSAIAAQAVAAMPKTEDTQCRLF